MPCSAQNVETAPRGASSGHCEIASRTDGSMGSLTATTRTLGQKCHHQNHPNCHRCPDAELSPMSWEITRDLSDPGGILEHMFESATPDVLVGEIEASQAGESALMAHRCAVIAALLALRTAEAEEADPDPGWSMITGFARTTAEVSAAMNMSPKGAQHLVGQAEAL